MTIYNDVYLFQYDVEGNISHIFDTNGNLQARYVYDAWGNHKIFNAQGIDISTNSSYNDHVGRINPFRYKGYFYDQYTGLYYLESRYYDPTVRRFINADSVAYIDPETFGGLNLYTYCGNNPIMYVDPTGHDWLHWAIAIGAVAVLTIATCGFAGGLGAGLMALTMAANGVAATSVATTVLAYATIGAATTLAASAAVAGIGAIEEWATGGSFTDGLMSISDYGETALHMTASAGVLNGVIGAMSVGRKTPRTGHYRIYNSENQVIYVGKGSVNRMNVSIIERQGQYGQWIETPNEQMAFVNEALDMIEFGGAQSMQGTLLNRINSPGLKYLFWWF